MIRDRHRLPSRLSTGTYRQDYHPVPQYYCLYRRKINQYRS